MMTYLKKVLAFSLLSYFSAAYSMTYPLPKPGDDVVGELQTAYLEPGDSIEKLARRYNVGYYEILEANPHLNPYALKAWEKVTIPSRFVLPKERKGIIINIAEMGLYYFPKDKNVVITEPVGIGRAGWETPLAKTWIMEKTKDPVWTVPESIKEHLEAKGIFLPPKVMPGPKNPLGKYAMRLALGSYLIHGTNQPYSVGKRSTSGCIRMYPEAVEQLFHSVEVGTPVKIINQPYKSGWRNQKLFLEAHQPLQEFADNQADSIQKAKEHITKNTKTKGYEVDWSLVDEIISGQQGVPILISY